MSSRGRGSWRALQSDGRVLAFVQVVIGGRVGSKAVGKPDKTTLFNLVRRLFCAPGTIPRTPQSRLQTALLRLNRPSISKLQPNTLFWPKRNGAFPKTCPGWPAP